jgi:hypothetical protein
MTSEYTSTTQLPATSSVRTSLSVHVLPKVRHVPSGARSRHHRFGTQVDDVSITIFCPAFAESA